jgi:periplasmic protein TonB
MTVQQPNNPGDFVALRADRGSVANLQGVAAVAPPDDLAHGSSSVAGSTSAATDLSNVVAFARARRGDSNAPPVVISPQDRLVPLLPGRPWLLGVLCSLIVHGGAFYALWHEPKPLQGIGIETVTVEIELGDNRPVGPAATLGPNQVEAKQVEELKPDEKIVEQERVVDAREVKPEVKFDVALTDVAREQPVEQPKELQKEPQPEQQQPEQQQVVAMVETPKAEMPTVLPRETPPDAKATIAVRREQPKAARPVEPKQKKAAQPSEAKVAAGGSGRTAVASLADYNGLVSAHLRRYQAGARISGVAGSGAVTFSLTGSGSVSSVRIAKSTGAAVLDQEILAMVRRASPFPTPPNGQLQVITVPLSFTLPR